MSNCDSICITEWVFSFLWLISVPIYCMVIYTIWKHRKTKFKEEFWVLTMALLSVDMLLLCQVMWGSKMARWGLLPSAMMRAPYLWGWLITVPQQTFKMAQEMGVLFVSINRYIAVTKPSIVFWSRKVTVLCICAQWTMAVFVTLCLAPGRYYLKNLDNNGSGFATTIDERDMKTVTTVLAGALTSVGGLVRFVVFIFMYGHMFYFIYKRNRVVNPVPNNKSGSQMNKDQQRSPRAKYNLIIIGACLVLCDMAGTINMIYMLLHLDQSSDNARLWSFRDACLSDIYGWVNGWLMLACSSAVRKQFLKQFRCVKQNN